MPKHVTTAADLAPARQLSDLVVALLRTAVPAWWGTLAAWAISGLVTLLPASISDSLATLLASDPAVALAVTVAIAAWYAVWRWLSPRVPDWLIRLALGSAQTPSYPRTAIIGSVEQVTTLSTTERDNLTQLAAALDPGDPGRTALQRVLTT